MELLEDGADTPEEVVLKEDRSAQVRHCLAQMSREHREVIDLVYYHEKSIEEVANIIRAPKNTVKTRMSMHVSDWPNCCPTTATSITSLPGRQHKPDTKERGKADRSFVSCCPKSSNPGCLHDFDEESTVVP